ncbi:hypothetical protein BDZ91DRAFT_836104 [Kalaharituber pfeilii]|nr:hypothetical protein BDZ91DRAFT_836104 [Kalaharituber pfeilii]
MQEYTLGPNEIMTLGQAIAVSLQHLLVAAYARTYAHSCMTCKASLVPSCTARMMSIGVTYNGSCWGAPWMQHPYLVLSTGGVGGFEGLRRDKWFCMHSREGRTRTWKEKMGREWARRGKRKGRAEEGCKRGRIATISGKVEEREGWKTVTATAEMRVDPPFATTGESASAQRTGRSCFETDRLQDRRPQAAGRRTAAPAVMVVYWSIRALESTVQYSTWRVPGDDARALDLLRLLLAAAAADAADGLSRGPDVPAAPADWACTRRVFGIHAAVCGPSWRRPRWPLDGLWMASGWPLDGRWPWGRRMMRCTAVAEALSLSHAPGSWVGGSAERNMRAKEAGMAGKTRTHAQSQRPGLAYLRYPPNFHLKSQPFDLRHLLQTMGLELECLQRPLPPALAGYWTNVVSFEALHP